MTLFLRSQIPSSRKYGWTEEDNIWKEIMMTELPAHESVIHLVKCGYVKKMCTNNARKQDYAAQNYAAILI